jgi:hypothetical protein
MGSLPVVSISAPHCDPLVCFDANHLTLRVNGAIQGTIFSDKWPLRSEGHNQLLTDMLPRRMIFFTMALRFFGK